MCACFEDQKQNTLVLCRDEPQLKYKSWMEFGEGIRKALNSTLYSLKLCADANMY